MGYYTALHYLLIQVLHYLSTFNDSTDNRALQYIDTNNAFYDGIDEIRFKIYDDIALTTQISKEYTFKIKESCADDCDSGGCVCTIK